MEDLKLIGFYLGKSFRIEILKLFDNHIYQHIEMTGKAANK